MSKIRYGTIQEEKGGWAKVLFETAAGNTISPMLPITQRSTVGDKDYRPLERGTLVAVMLDDDGDGVIMGAIYNAKDKVPEESLSKAWVKRFRDGSMVSYDLTTHTMTLRLVGPLAISFLGQYGGTDQCVVTADHVRVVAKQAKLECSESCDLLAPSGEIRSRCHYDGQIHHFGL